MSESEPHPRLTPAQVTALGSLCARYGVEYDAGHYYIYPADSAVMPLWAEGWVGGPQHANPDYQRPEEPAGKPTIYCGVSPSGEVHT